MKRKSILALILVTIVVVSLSLVGCGRNYSRTKTGNNATGNNATGTPNTGTDGDEGIGTGGSGTSGSDTSGSGSSGSGTSGSGAIGNGTSGTNANGTANNATGAAGNNSQGMSNSLQYGATNFRDDVVNAGYNLQEAANRTENYFKGNETDYLAGNDVVRVYEYNSAQDLEGDIERISENGLTINGTDANYTTKPNYYRKGNSLIVYEGNEPSYVNYFNTMYGNTLIP